MTTFIRLLDVPVEEKALVLRKSITTLAGGDVTSSDRVFDRDPSLFSTIPGSPLAYWVSDQLREMFLRLPRFESPERTAKCGMGTLDDFRFLRARYEVTEALGDSGPVPKQWVDYVGPRQRSLAYADLPLQVNWKDDGRELKAFVEAKVGSASRKIQSEGYYFRPGLAWPLRGSRFSAQEVPSGCVFSVAGKMAFVPTEDLFFFLGLFNASVFDALIGLFAGKVGGVQYEAGLIQDLPVPAVELSDRDRMGNLARAAWCQNRALDTLCETSTSFLLPEPLNQQVTGLNRDAAERELLKLQPEIDDLAYAFYGMSADDRRTIEASAHNGGEASQEGGEGSHDNEVDDVANSDIDDRAVEGGNALLSWLVGVAFGRFDPRLATGERPLPRLRDPFEALPNFPPAACPPDYTPDWCSDIFVDDEGHPADLATNLRRGAELVIVDVRGDLRTWLKREFFPLHIRMYSKSRRKAPIYWQLATSSANYSVWLYIHAFTKDTLFRVQNDYVAPKLAHEERRLEAMRQELQEKSTAGQRKDVAGQESFVRELRALVEELKRVAPLWEPNLDDGVVINFAPLWRLVPHNKPWQRELKATWEALCAGKYDWAHLAMHLWPERVVAKCASDRSLAIAHALENVFWVEGSDGKWTARKTPTRPVDGLIRERASPAVKSALKALLDAAAVGKDIQGTRHVGPAVEGAHS
jgi:hypothetical protein